MKKMVLILLFSTAPLLTGCGMIQETISMEEDATVALKQPDLDVRSFRYADLDALKKILSERVKKYDAGLSYLVKSSKLYKGEERVVHERKIEEVKAVLSFVRAHMENFVHVYPDQWNDKRADLNELLVKVRDLYKKAYDGLI